MRPQSNWCTTRNWQHFRLRKPRLLWDESSPLFESCPNTWNAARSPQTTKIVAGKPKTSRGQSFPQAPGGTRYENATLRAQAGRRRTSRGQSFTLPGGMPVGGRGFALCQQEKTVRNFTTATRMTSRDESLPLPGVTWSRKLVISFISVTHRP